MVNSPILASRPFYSLFLPIVREHLARPGTPVGFPVLSTLPPNFFLIALEYRASLAFIFPVAILL